MRSTDHALSRLAALALLLIVMLPRTAHAYIDPTAGSVVFQAIAAGVLAGAFTIKLWWNGLRNSTRGLWARLTRR